jgi:uncharacterized iron-regulated membrane protein
MTVRAFLLWSHRWLGLVWSLLIAVAGITGALLLLPIPQPTLERIVGWHVDLGAGPAGVWVVLAATIAALLLQLGGLYLWWPTKRLRLRRDRGWWRFAYDLHNLAGVVGLPLMGLIAATAVGRVVLREYPLPPSLWMIPRAVSRLHTADGLPLVIQALWFAASAAFAVQAVTGVLVWWRQAAARPADGADG